MTEDSSLLFQVLVLLSAAVLAVPLFHRLGIGAVLGYLVAGMAVGPHALALIDDVEDIRRLAEFGVVFLLFAIGLELKLSRLVAMRRLVFGLGGLQVALTASLLAGAVVAASDIAWGPAVIIGGGLALSSTAVVLQILTERGELTARAGRAAFAILLMQDLAVVPLLMLVTALGGAEHSTPLLIAEALGRALLIGAAIVIIGRYLVRPALRLVATAHSSEVFAAAAVLVVLGTAWATQQAGLSMALGAFMAGLLLAETEYRHQIEADIQPFRGFLLGLFFMTVGMGLDIGLLARDAKVVVGLLAALMTLKAAVAGGLALTFGLGPRVAVHVGLLLAQGGEFAFVVFGQATALGVLEPAQVAPLTLAVTASMFATPLLAVGGAALADRLERHGADGRLAELADVHGHVIICGFGRVGRLVAHLLTERAIPYVALDLSSERVLAARAVGLPVFFADASREEVLKAAGAARARALVVTLDRAGAAEHAIAAASTRYPDLPVFARARDHEHASVLLRHGATQVVPEAVEASVQLGASVLRALGTPASVLDPLLDDARRHGYGRLGGDEIPKG